MKNLQPKIEMSRVRQTLIMNLREMESFLYVLQKFDTPEINYIKQHIEQTIIHLTIITKNMERLEQDQNEFFNACN